MTDYERRLALEYEHITALYEAWDLWVPLRALESQWEEAMGNVNAMESVRNEAMTRLSRWWQTAYVR